MYNGTIETPISDDYRNEMKKTTRFPTIIRGTVLLDGHTFEFRNEDLLEKSLKIDNSIENNYGLSFGSVYMGRCVFTLKTCNYDGTEGTPLSTTIQKAILDKTLIIDLFQFYEDDPKSIVGKYDYIPMGIYKINNIEKAGKYYSITAYDLMQNFDKEINLRRDTETDDLKPSDLISQACDNCSVRQEQDYTVLDKLSPKSVTSSLGTLYDNISLRITKEEEKSIGTWRNLLSLVATVMGGFLFINRMGSLQFRKLGTENVRDETLITYNPYTSPVLYKTTDKVKISNQQIKGLKYGDLQNEYSSFTFTIKGKTVSYKYGAPLSSAVQREIDMGDIPATLTYQSGTAWKTDGETKLKSSLTNELSKNAISGSLYYRTYAGEFEYILGDPTIDLGDVINVDVAESGTSTYRRFLVTSYVWTYHGGHKIKSIGMDTGAYQGSTQLQKSQTAKNTMQTVYSKMEPIMETNFNNVTLRAASYTTVITATIPDTIKGGDGKVLVCGNLKITDTSSSTSSPYTIFLLCNQRIVFQQQLSGGDNVICFNFFTDAASLSSSSTMTLSAASSKDYVSVNANDAQLIILPYMR